MQVARLTKATAGLASLALGVVLALALNAGAVHAQTTGKIIGTVADSDTGQPLVGAQVVIEGTNIGNISNEDGYYFINNVPVGIQRLAAQYLGYQTTGHEQRVLAGQTHTVNFSLESEVVQADVIVATIEREPLVARDNTISKTRFTAEDSRNLPVGSIAELVDLAAGVYQGQGGFIIRGGRGSESATYVDGVLITDFLDQRNTTSVSTFSIEEVDVITGGFEAQFGHAQSGIINIVTREAQRDWTGSVRYTTDEISPEQSYGFNNISASFGGPVIPERLTFYASGAITGADDFSPRSGGFNPVLGFTTVPDRDGDGVPEVIANSSGSTEQILPGARGDDTQFQAKLTSFLPANAKLTGTYIFNRNQRENYTRTASLNQFLVNNGTRTKTHDIILGWDQQLYQSSERQVNLQVRGNFHRTNFFAGIPLTPEVSRVLLARLGPTCGTAAPTPQNPNPPDFSALCSITEDTFEDDFLGWRVSDVEFLYEGARSGTIFNLPNQSNREPDPVFGVPRLWFSDGLATDFRSDDQEDRVGIRADVDAQLNRVHRAKVGVEHTWIELAVDESNLQSSTFADVYDVKPRVLGVYVQDRLDYGDLVIDLGLRYDRWDPNQAFPGVVDETTGEVIYAPGLVPETLAQFENQFTEGAVEFEAPVRDEWAPRIGVAHPITDRTQVRLSYGKFYQLPELGHYFSSFLTNFPGNPNITYGNANLDYVETTAFEAGVTTLISENLVIDVVGYNRDRRGAIRLDVFQPRDIHPAVDERRVFTNGDNGNVKGFDITLQKRYSNYFSTDLAWSLQWARGTTSSPVQWATGGGFGRLTDPLEPGRLLVPPAQLQPEDFDRLHNINWQFQLRFPADYREGTTLGTVLGDFGAAVVYNAQSGNPYTRRTIDSRAAPAEDLGSSRLPWIHSGDIRLTKGFDLAGTLGFDVFAQIENFLDIKNVIDVHATTGRPDVSGFEFDDAPRVPTEFLAEGVAAAFPYRVQDVIESTDDPVNPIPIRSRIAKQDLNGDGLITEAEAAEILFEARRVSGVIGGTNATVVGDSPFNYGAPRQIRFGVEVRF
jgi:outer membrane cobalamin receptor